MRTYDVCDADDNVLRTEEMEDSMAPSLLAGQKARLVAIDGEPLAKSAVAVIGAAGADEPELQKVGDDPLLAANEAEAKALAKAAKAEAKAAKADADAEPAKDA